MIFLFDNCYLSTTNQIVENVKHVWIGNHSKLKEDLHFDSAFNIIGVYETINSTELDKLFENIHTNHSDDKVVLYCDVDNFEYVYHFFFGALLPKSGVDEMYSLDIKKENYGFFNKVNVVIPNSSGKVTEYSKYASSLKQMRLEVVFSNLLNGKTELKTWLIDRIDTMWDGSPGLDKQRAMLMLPVLMSDDEYQIENLLDDSYVEEYLKKFDTKDFLPYKINNVIKETFGYDHIYNFLVVLNNNTTNFAKDWETVSKYTKREFIDKCILNTDFNYKLELLFPNVENYDSINPLLWNEIVRNAKNKLWLDKYTMKYGINNKTN